MRSQVLFAIRPWTHEQDMSEITEMISSMKTEGITLGASTIVDVGYEVKELLQTMLIDEDLISVEQLLDDFISATDLISQVSIRLWNRPEQ